MTSQKTPILFWSEHCAYSRMLVDTIRRKDPEGALVRLVSADGVRLPPQITHVPALLMPDKQLLLGRAAFDSLLLPGRGLLLKASPAAAPLAQQQSPSAAAAGPGEPLAVNATMGGAAFAFIDAAGTTTGLPAGMAEFNLTNSAAAPSAGGGGDGAGESTRSKKGLPGLDELRSQRDADMAALSPPAPKLTS